MAGLDLLRKLAWAFCIPGAVFFVVMLIKVVFELRKARRRLEAIHAERLKLARICVKCGYDVRAARKEGASGVCPECGERL